MSARHDPRIAIIGAGFGGVGLAVKLKRAGLKNFTVYEKSGGVGGTWWDNVYPGAEVDTPSVLYSYSFMPAVWSRTHVQQAELQAYIARVAEHFGIMANVRLNTTITRAAWDKGIQAYRLYSDDTEIATADHVVSAVGLLNDPKEPNWPGIETFTGQLMHSARWEQNVDVTGKRVGVIGTGSTAAQLVPALAQSAEHLTVFQRDPGWVLPKLGRAYTDEERKALRSSTAQRIARMVMLLRREQAQRGGTIYRPGSEAHTKGQASAVAFIKESFADRPDLEEAVTPKYPFWGKRPIISDDFYPALKRPNVTLVPLAAARITAKGVVDASGQEHEIDVLALSTGFRVEFLSTLKVVNASGVELHDYWAGDATAFLGIMVPEFPNFFLLYGPNTNGGAIVSMLELQSDYIVAAIRRARHSRTIEVRSSALAGYDAIIQERMKDTIFHYPGNYFKSPSGKITTQWPDGVVPYAVLTRILRSPVWILDKPQGPQWTPAELSETKRGDR